MNRPAMEHPPDQVGQALLKPRDLGLVVFILVVATALWVGFGAPPDSQIWRVVIIFALLLPVSAITGRLQALVSHQAEHLRELLPPGQEDDEKWMDPLFPSDADEATGEQRYLP